MKIWTKVKKIYAINHPVSLYTLIEQLGEKKSKSINRKGHKGKKEERD
jgi:hypothetical protein